MVMLERPVEPDAPLTGWWGSYPGHKGLDYGWLFRDPARTKRVYAALGGTVIYVYGGGGDNQGWGNRVIIDHGHGVRTAYSHFANGTITVRVGQQVDTGHYLGQMGATGRATGDHLHFELYLNGDRVDPRPYREGKPLPIPEPSGGSTPNPTPITPSAEEAPLMYVLRNAVNGDCFIVGPKRIKHLGSIADLNAARKTFPYRDLDDRSFRVALIGFNVPHSRAVKGADWQG